MIGQTISHYRILEKLGEGGMGVVYEATDLNLDRSVALKFLPPELTRDPEAKARFVHEAKAASALDHPNVCTVYEINETKDGRMFMAMACYEGETLKERIAQGPLPIDEAVDISRQIAEGLAKAHEGQIVHRDIKPANIFVTKDSLVKIVDFGLAKLSGQTRLTQTGTTLGTVAYMPPEQARGEETDHRGDLWSLGALLYEMVTGRIPFAGDNEQAVIYAILNEEPKPPTGLRTGVPLELERIIGKCLAKDLKERYQSAAGFLSDLGPLKKNLQAGRPSVTKVMDKRGAARIRPGWPWVVALVLLGVGLGIVGWKLFLTGEGSSEKERTIAVVDFSDLNNPDDLSSSTALTSLVNTALTEHSPIRVVSLSYLQDIRRRLFGSSRNPITADQALEVARRAGAGLLLSGEITQLGEEQHVMWRLTDTGSGESVAAQRVQGRNLILFADLVVGGVLPLLGSTVDSGETSKVVSVTEMTTQSEQAYMYFLTGILAREESRIQNELHALERAVAIDTTFALAFYELSRFYGREHGLAREYSDKAWSLRSKLGFKDRMRLEAWRAWGDYRVLDALAIHREMNKRWPDDQEILMDLVEKLYANWFHVEALQTVERACEIYPDNNRFSLFRWACLGVPGRMDEALAFARARTHKRADLSVNWENLGWQYLWMGQVDSAEVAFHRSIAIEPQDAWAPAGLASCAFALGDVGGAIEAFQRVLARTDLPTRQILEWRTRFTDTSLGLAWLYAEAGHITECLSVIEETRRFATDPETELRHVTLARQYLLLRTGHAEEVLGWARENKNAAMRVARLQATKYEALALVALDSLDTARRALDDLRSTEDFWGGYTHFMVDKITAMIALAEGDLDSAQIALQRLGSYAFPGGMYDIEYRELLARAHYLTGRLEEAAAAHREILQVFGGHALAHYELGKLYEEMNRPDDAEQEYTIFLDMWGEADEGLPELEDARQRLQALKARM